MESLGPKKVEFQDCSICWMISEKLRLLDMLDASLRFICITQLMNRMDRQTVAKTSSYFMHIYMGSVPSL
mgnify:CR=1 FL=1